MWFCWKNSLFDNRNVYISWHFSVCRGFTCFSVFLLRFRNLQIFCFVIWAHGSSTSCCRRVVYQTRSQFCVFRLKKLLFLLQFPTIYKAFVGNNGQRFRRMQILGNGTFANVVACLDGHTLLYFYFVFAYCKKFVFKLVLDLDPDMWFTTWQILKTRKIMH